VQVIDTLQTFSGAWVYKLSLGAPYCTSLLEATLSALITGKKADGSLATLYHSAVAAAGTATYVHATAPHNSISPASVRSHLSPTPLSHPSFLLPFNVFSRCVAVGKSKANTESLDLVAFAGIFVIYAIICGLTLVIFAGMFLRR